MFEEVEEFLVHGGGMEAGFAFYFCAGHFAKEEAGFVVPNVFAFYAKIMDCSVNFSACHKGKSNAYCAGHSVIF